MPLDLNVTWSPISTVTNDTARINAQHPLWLPRDKHPEVQFALGSTSLELLESPGTSRTKHIAPEQRKRLKGEAHPIFSV